MRQDEAREIAEKAARDLWGASGPLRVEPYRRWIVAGRLRWRAFGRVEGRTVQLVLDDASGEILEAGRAEAGRQPASVVIEQLTGVLVVGALVGIFLLFGALSPTWLTRTVTVALALTLVVGSLLWLRVRLMARMER